MVEALGDEGGDLRQAAVAAAGLAAVLGTGVQHDGVHRLHHRRGQVAAAAAGDIQIVQHRVGGENLGATLAAEENDPLVKDAQALRLGTAGSAGADLESDPVEKPHIDGVEPPVEGDGLHVGIDVEQLRRAAPHHLAGRQHLLSRCRGVKAQILHAVLVTAGVEDLMGMDADGLTHAAQIADRAGHTVFRHRKTSYLSTQGHRPFNPVYASGPAGCGKCRRGGEKPLYKPEIFHYNRGV